MKNELSSFWQQTFEKAKSSPSIMQDLNMELFQRSIYKQRLNEPPKINKLDGGLLMQISQSSPATNPYSESIF